MAYAKKNQQPVTPGDPIQFVAEPFHYAISDEDLLADLRAVAERISDRTVFPQQYEKHGRYSSVSLRNRFGSWADALTRAGLQPSHPRPVQNDAILRDIVEVAKKIGVDDLRRSHYIREGRFGTTTVGRHFGSWTAAKLAAGLTAVAPAPRHPTDDHLFENFERLWRSLGRQPRGRDVTLPHSRYDVGAYRRRFGGFREALAAFIAHQREIGKTSATHEPTGPLIRHKTPREVRPQLRYQILRRDRFRCCACGRSPSTDPAIELHIDHIHPWSLGGETTPQNLQTLCAECNSGKGGRSPNEKR